MLSDPAWESSMLRRLRGADREGRREAEREFFAAFHAPVERLLRRLLNRDLDDAVQEVFVDLFRGLPAFEGKAKLFTWVYRVALRRGWKCLAARRGRERRGASAGASVECLPAARTSVELSLQASELAQRFESALRRLELEQRTVMALSAIDGLGPPEIAEVLGVPIGTIHSRLHRARQRMREWLELS